MTTSQTNMIENICYAAGVLADDESQCEAKIFELMKIMGIKFDVTEEEIKDSQGCHRLYNS